MELHASGTVTKHGVEVGQKSTGKARRRQKMRAVRTNGVKTLFCCPPHMLFCISIHRGSLARAPPGQRRPQGHKVQQLDGSKTSPNLGLAAPQCQATSHARSAPSPGESQSFQRSCQLAVTPGVLIHAAPKAAKPQGRFGMLPRKSAAATSAHVVPGGKAGTSSTADAQEVVHGAGGNRLCPGPRDPRRTVAPPASPSAVGRMGVNPTVAKPGDRCAPRNPRVW